MNKIYKGATPSIICFILVFLTALFSLPGGKYFELGSFSENEGNWVYFSPKDRPLVLRRFDGGVSAISWVAIDASSGAILGGENINQSLPPASLTKVVTALVVLEDYSLDQVLRVGSKYPVGKIMGVSEGERFKVVDLLTGLMIHSANDAAFVLADSYFGGSNGFIDRMNDYVEERGLKRTHFSNFDGEEGNDHYTTAYEIGQLSRILMKEPLVRQLVQTKQKFVYNLDGKPYLLENTNELLESIPENRGLKTGWTEQAGECFVGLFEIEKDQETHEVITVVLGSDDRFAETIRILGWLRNSIEWVDYSSTHSTEIAGTKAAKS